MVDNIAASQGHVPELPMMNVLILDGGGVRGLSSLLILQALMIRINANLKAKGYLKASDSDLCPQDIFRFAGGTSTGGLIAIMLGKLGMSVEACIDKYYELSRTIFKKKHVRGNITRGLATARYSGKTLRESVRKLLHERGLDKDHAMIHRGEEERMACAVVCREHSTISKYSELKQNPVCLCSLPCQRQPESTVCDAARATSAAPTFFPVAEIEKRCFVDGGMEYNNPSQAIHYHYTEAVRARAARKSSVSDDINNAAAATHGTLDFTTVRFVNLGTGTKADSLPERRRDVLVSFLPGFIRMGVFLKRTLTEIAVNSEQTANVMGQLAWISKGDFRYERFSADNGVCYIKLDKYMELDRIANLTQEYIALQTKRLNQVAQEIATDHIRQHRPSNVIPSATAGAVPERASLIARSSPSESARSRNATLLDSETSVSSQSTHPNEEEEAISSIMPEHQVGMAYKSVVIEVNGTERSAGIPIALQC